MPRAIIMVLGCRPSYRSQLIWDSIMRVVMIVTLWARPRSGAIVLMHSDDLSLPSS